MNRLLALACTVLFLLLAQPVQAQRLNVIISSTAEDPVGSRLATRLRETIATSPLFTLIYDEDKPAIKLAIVTLDPDSGNGSSGTRTIYSLVILLHAKRGGLDTFLDTYVGVCGSQRLDSCSDRIKAAVDKQATIIREALAAPN